MEFGNENSWADSVKMPSPSSSKPTILELFGNAQAGHLTGLHTGAGNRVVHESEQFVDTVMGDEAFSSSGRYPGLQVITIGSSYRTV